MSDENTEHTPSPAAPGKMPLLLAVVVGIVIGAGSGTFVVGPLLAKNPPSQKVIDASGEEEEQPDEADAKGGKDAAPRPMHAVDNIIINPAESNGSRFLMLTVTFEMRDASAVDLMKTRDPEVRDALLSVLGSKSVEQLADPAQREPLKEEIRTTVDALFKKKGAVRKLYFPQFVIQ